LLRDLRRNLAVIAVVFSKNDSGHPGLGAAPNWLSGSKVELRLADNAFESSQSRPFFFTDSKVRETTSWPRSCANFSLL
jgi:hypothetical protein